MLKRNLAKKTSFFLEKNLFAISNLVLGGLFGPFNGVNTGLRELQYCTGKILPKKILPKKIQIKYFKKPSKDTPKLY